MSFCGQDRYAYLGLKILWIQLPLAPISARLALILVFGSALGHLGGVLALESKHITS